MNIPLNDPRFAAAGLVLETNGKTTKITKEGTVLSARVLTEGDQLIFHPDASTNQKVVLAILSSVEG